MTQPTTEHAKILIADDHKVVAEGLAISLSRYFAVVSQVHELEALIPAIQRHRPQVVVLDITFAGASSLPVMSRALERGEIATRFVVLTAHDSSALERAAFNAGAHAFLLKGVGIDELRLAIEAALTDRRYVTPTKRATVERSAGARSDRTLYNIDGVQLRAKQIQVLLVLQEGLSRQQAADRLELTIRGVDFHLNAAKKAVGITKLQVLLNWVAERREVLESALRLRVGQPFG
ncbi:MAG TPA: response regulator transcription factor [Gemmatimonadales bacterium]|nr:response regulator transcription factor [Gemmatimonadales bacterium]